MQLNPFSILKNRFFTRDLVTEKRWRCCDYFRTRVISKMHSIIQKQFKSISQLAIVTVFFFCIPYFSLFIPYKIDFFLPLFFYLLQRCCGLLQAIAGNLFLNNPTFKRVLTLYLASVRLCGKLADFNVC